MAKITIEQLLAKRLDDNKKKTVLFRSEELGGDLEVNKIQLSKVLTLLDGSEALSMADNMARNFELIYECCPILHNSELQKSYEVVEPSDIVAKILNDNIGEINRLLMPQEQAILQAERQALTKADGVRLLIFRLALKLYRTI